MTCIGPFHVYKQFPKLPVIPSVTPPATIAYKYIGLSSWHHLSFTVLTSHRIMFLLSRTRKLHTRAQHLWHVPYIRTHQEHLPVVYYETKYFFFIRQLDCQKCMIGSFLGSFTHLCHNTDKRIYWGSYTILPAL